MIYAITEEGKRIGPEPSQHAFCPGCRAPVISKCGDINVWHWAHVTGKEGAKEPDFRPGEYRTSEMLDADANRTWQR